MEKFWYCRFCGNEGTIDEMNSFEKAVLEHKKFFCSGEDESLFILGNKKELEQIKNVSDNSNQVHFSYMTKSELYN